MDPGAHPAALRKYDTNVMVQWTGVRESNGGFLSLQNRFRGTLGLYKLRDAAAGNHQTSASCFRGLGFDTIDTFATVDHRILVSELGITGTALST